MGNSGSTAAQASHAARDATYSNNVPSPKLCGTTQLTDEGIASYIELPEDTFYMEALAQNALFDSINAYVPAQRYVKSNGREETHIYSIRPGITDAEHLLGPIGALDDQGRLTTDITPFGVTLSSTGILYVAAWNRNSVLAYDLSQPLSTTTPVPPLFEIQGLATPNDIALDPNNDSILYVAGGTFLGGNKNCQHESNSNKRRKCIQYSNPTCGKIFRVDVNQVQSTDYDIEIFSTNHLTLAGIEIVNNVVWAAQLYDIFVQNVNKQQLYAAEVVWKGREDSAVVAALDNVWLADNVDVYDDTFVVIPAFSVAPTWSVELGASNPIMATLANLFLQISTSFQNEDETILEGLKDPFVDLSFSNTYIQDGVPPAPIRLIFMNTIDDTISATATPERSKEEAVCEGVFHLEIDLVETRANNPPREVMDPETGEVLGMRHYFNEQVTHAAHLTSSNGEGFLALVNFEQPRVLLLQENAFRPTLDLPVQTVPGT